MRKLIERRRDEAGAILILSTVGVVVALVAAALAIDLGQIAQEKRHDQKIADLAALDAARDPSNACARAKATATKNGFTATLNCTDPVAVGMDVELGSMGAGGFMPASSGSVVRVTVRSPVENTFVPGSHVVQARGIAGSVPRGGFMIGSSLATLDTSRVAILNRVLGGMITDPDANLTLALVSWQGLANGHVTLNALRTELAAMGFTAGSVNGLLNANTMTLNNLFTATANALSGSDAATVAAKAAMLSLAGQVTSTATFKLGDFIEVAQGADNMALGSQMNVFQIVTAAAQVANGNNFIDVSNIGITVPNVTSTRVSLQVIEPPKFYFGSVGGYVETAQIDLTVAPDLDVPITIPGLTNARISTELPVHITGAGARGTLKTACGGSPDNMVVTVDPAAFSGSASTTVEVDAQVSLLGLGVVGVTVKVPTTTVVPAVDGGPTDLGFAHPSQFPPTEVTKHAGSQPIGLQSLTQVSKTPSLATTIEFDLLGASASVDLNVATTNTLAAIPAILGQVDNQVVTPLLTALGVDVGSADVTPVAMECGSPGLLG